MEQIQNQEGDGIQLSVKPGNNPLWYLRQGDIIIYEGSRLDCFRERIRIRQEKKRIFNQQKK